MVLFVSRISPQVQKTWTPTSGLSIPAAYLSIFDLALPLTYLFISLSVCLSVYLSMLPRLPLCQSITISMWNVDSSRVFLYELLVVLGQFVSPSRQSVYTGELQAYSGVSIEFVYKAEPSHTIA